MYMHLYVISEERLSIFLFFFRGYLIILFVLFGVVCL
jgi:hypothetical protein